MNFDLKKQTFSFDTMKGEPAMRSCWICNPAHEHLKNTNFPHYCYLCGRYWICGKFFDEFETLEKLKKFVETCGKLESEEK